MKYSDYVGALKDYFIKMAIDKSYEYLINKFVLLQWGPLGPIIKLFLKKIVIIIVEQTGVEIYFKYTDFRVSREGRKFYKALVENKQAQEGGNENDVKKAEENLKKSFRDLITLDNY